MDDDDVPQGPAAAPPQLPTFSAYRPAASAAVWPAAAAGAMLGGGVLEGAAVLATDLDECDVWDGVEEKDEMGPVAGVEGEEDDLMLDMLRSQQDGQFIIAGESVLGDAGLVPGFVADGSDVVGGDGGGVVLADVAGAVVLEGITLNSVPVEGEKVSQGVDVNVEALFDDRMLSTVVIDEKEDSEEAKSVETKVAVVVAEVGSLVGDGREEVVVSKRGDQEGACVGDKLAEAGRTSEEVLAGGELREEEKAGEEANGMEMELAVSEVRLPDRDNGKIVLDGAQAVEVEISREMEAMESDSKMDVDVVVTHGVDPEESCKLGDAREGGGAVSLAERKEEGGQIDSETHHAVPGNEVALASPSKAQECKEVVGNESGGVELGVVEGMHAVDDTDSTLPTDARECGVALNGMDDAQFLDATMHSVGEAGKADDASSLVPPAVAGAAKTEGLLMDANEDLNNSGNLSTKGPGRKKRGRQSKAQVPKPFVKKGEEDVCFICFDGGNLVVCDRRGCPKVYHPSCINRDEAFFKARGRWNCGWHICSICEKASQHMCYTCTYSLCKGCMKQSKFVLIRGNKGLCETCRGMVMLIETNDPAAANFYDRNSWEYLFKDYWMDVKQRLSLTFDEITKGKKSSKKASVRNEESSDDVFEVNEGASSSDSSSGRGSSTRKRTKKRPPTIPNEESSVTVVDSEGSSFPEDGNWASKELLEFVSHMKDGDTAVLSQFEVQALLLDYIKQNNLRDPRRKSQIICDSRLTNLFGKTRVGHFEMLKLLESHFLLKESSNVVAEDQMAVGDPDSRHLDAEGSSDAVRMTPEKKRKGRKKEDRELQTNFDDYAAINVHNISLIYLRRNLMEELLDDEESFNEKVVGSFVKIRIPATGQKQDMYRLAKIIGTTKAAAKYQTGKRMTEIALDILNLNKTEVISIDTISNQEFTEEECKRLRQSIKYGFIPRMTVGELHEKARDLQSVRVNDWLETEKARLAHLRDRASETGRRKQLRECVEKLELLPEEHARRLNDIPEVHSDPHMDPDYESAEEEPEDRKRDFAPRQRGSGYFRKGKEMGSSERGPVPSESWNGARRGSIASSESRNVNDTVMKQMDTMHGSSWGCGRDVPQPNSLESQGSRRPPTLSQNVGQSSEPTGQGHLSSTSVSTPSLVNGVTVPTRHSVNESEKVWHYQDPTGKTQGPFSMVQLRKWNSTGYFPRDLRIWKSSEKQEDSVLLADALIGKFEKDLPARGSQQGGISQPPSPVIDGRDNRDANRNSDPSWVEKKPGVQDHGGAWTPSRSTAFPSSVSNFDRQTHPTGSSLQQLPAQQGMQPSAPNFGTNPGQGLNVADRNSPAGFVSNMASSNRGNQPRTRVSRWEPETGSTFMHGARSFNEGKTDTSHTTAALGNASSIVAPVSHTPNGDQLRGFPSANALSRSSTLHPNLLPAKVSISCSDSLTTSVGPTSQDKSHSETLSSNSLLQRLESFPNDPNVQNNFSPIRAEGSVVPHLDPGAVSGTKQSPQGEMVAPGSQPSSNWIASADAKHTQWSMPSPTPTSEVAMVDAQVARANNRSAFSDGGRHLASGQPPPDSSAGPAPQPIALQAQVQMGNQSSGWGFASENPAINAMATTQAAAGWGTQMPANASMAWVAPGTTNVGWNAVPQGNANVVGWVPAAAGAPIVSAIPQVAVPGAMNPAGAGWGAVAQVVPQGTAGWAPLQQATTANPAWGANNMQGFPNANAGWVQQQANTDPNMGWAPQHPGNPNANIGWAVPNGNSNPGWGSPGNPNANNPRGSHPRDQKDNRYGWNNGDSGHGGGRHRVQNSGGGAPPRDPQGMPWGICKFHESGRCKKGASCNFLHT